MAKKPPKKQASKKTIDYDGLIKDFVTTFFKEAILLMHPALYHAIDWSVPVVFLEQELINAMRGKHKIPGKRRQTDKLARVRLKNGKDHFILIHLEFQHYRDDRFPWRMNLYRSLISLRYDIEDISAIVLFSGDPPPEEQRFYYKNTFGSELIYKYTCYVAAEQWEEVLLQSDNPMAWAVLAMKYAQQTKGVPLRRLELKKKLFEESTKKGIEKEKLVKLLIFVRDLVDLPKQIDNEFEINVFQKYFPQPETTMKVSQGTKDFAERFYEKAYGYSPKKLKRRVNALEKAHEALTAAREEAVREAAAREEAVREAAAREEAVREAAAREAAAREAAAREVAIREAAAREVAIREQTIVRLFKELHISIEDLARIYSLETAYIESVITSASDAGEAPSQAADNAPKDI